MKINKMEQNQPKQLQIKASNDDLKGRYSNVMRTTHTREEFVLDFFNASMPVGALVARVIVSPGHFKRMVGALQTNLKNYETQFGSIEVAKEPEGKIGFGTKN